MFIVDDEDLNKGGTGAVQKELIREHFGMTQDIHDVITGATRFTQMSPLQRRDWITKLSATDFTYVLDLYAKVKKGARDSSAVVKHNNNRLVTESSRLMDENDVATLLNRSRELRSELDVLLRECNNVNDDTTYLANRLRSEHTELEKQIQYILKTSRFYAPEGYRFRSMDELEQAITNLNMDVAGKESVLHELGTVFQSLEASMHSLKSVEGMDEGYIRDQIRELSSTIDQLKGKLVTSELLGTLQYDNVGHAMIAIEDFKNMAYEITVDQCDRYPDNAVSEKRARLDQLTEGLRTLSSRVSNIEGRITHIENCGETSCPKCTHTFKIGVQDGEHDKLKQTLTLAAVKEKEIEAEVHETREWLDGANRFQNAMARMQQHRQRNPQLSGFWSYIDRLGGIRMGRELTPAIGRYLVDIVTADEIGVLSKQLDLLKESIASIEKLSGESKGIREQYHEYSTRIGVVTQEIQELHKNRDRLEDYKRLQDRLDESCNKLSQQVNAVIGLQGELVEAIRQKEVRGLIKDQQISLAMVENTLTESEIQQGIVNDIRKEITTVSLEEQAFKLLMDMLSPADGLIAEQIGIFINVIIDRMNAVIARIWGYNLAIKACDLSEGNLDYRFPVYSVAEDNHVPDISNGSDSQIDIIDQAFRLITYKFLDLNGYPLYLDELGRSFDPVHRHNLIPTVKDLIDDSTYSQVFMISHYLDGQNSYPNTEIIVIDDAHIDIKRTYNEHVTFA